MNPVASSTLDKSKSTMNALRYNYVREYMPYSEGELTYHEVVRSPVVNIKSDARPENIDYRFPIQLNLETDFIY